MLWVRIEKNEENLSTSYNQCENIKSLTAWQDEQPAGEKHKTAEMIPQLTDENPVFSPSVRIQAFLMWLCHFDQDATHHAKHTQCVQIADCSIRASNWAVLQENWWHTVMGGWSRVFSDLIIGTQWRQKTGLASLLPSTQNAHLAECSSQKPLKRIK